MKEWMFTFKPQLNSVEIVTNIYFIKSAFSILCGGAYLCVHR